MARKHPGIRLREFRVESKLSLRAAAKQLFVKHPALKDWEDGAQVPSPPYRAAIEIWTNGAIRAVEWPPTVREREIVEHAGRVRPVVPAESGHDITVDLARAG